MVDCLIAYGDEEISNALQAKDREQYQFWQGWVAALGKVPKESELLAAGEARAAALQRQLEQLTEKVTHQRGELANVNVVLRRKNVELAALHFVWCSGPCGETVTQAIVTEAIRNTDRLIEKFNGQRSNRAWKALHEYPDDQKALVSAWGDLRKETARAEAAEAAIVSLQAEFDAQQRELTDWKTDEKNISDAYLRVRALLGAYDTDFGGRNRFEVTERHIKELLKFREQLLTLQAQLQAITQEMREKGGRLQAMERHPMPV